MGREALVAWEDSIAELALDGRGRGGSLNHERRQKLAFRPSPLAARPTVEASVQQVLLQPLRLIA